MKAILQGNYMQASEYRKKDGTVIPEAVFYSGGETVKIRDLVCNLPEFTPLTVAVDIRTNQYGTTYHFIPDQPPIKIIYGDQEVKK